MKPATSPTSRRWAENHGFALIETVAMLLILGLLSAVVLPHWNRSSNAAELREAAIRTAMLLRVDRNAALRGGVDVLTRVDVTRRLVTSGAAPTSVRWPSDIDIKFIHSSRWQSGDGGAVLFRADGRSSGGAIFLRGPSSSYRISVDWATGRVSLGGGNRIERELRS